MFAEPNDLPILDPKTHRPDRVQLYQLQEDYTVHVGINSLPFLGNTYITVPKGYITDLASIPRWLWGLSGLTPDGLYRGAATVHDYIYSLHVRGTNYSELPTGRRLSRADCDDIFRQLIVQSGDTKWRQFAMYHAVRMFGWLFY